MPSSAFARSPSSTLFPYTTLFRSVDVRVICRAGQVLRRDLDPDRLQLLLDHLHRGDPVRVAADVEDPEGQRLAGGRVEDAARLLEADRKSTRLNSSHLGISYAVFCFRSLSELYTLSLHDALPICRRPRHMSCWTGSPA